jgi:hypothetical protein
MVHDNNGFFRDGLTKRIHTGNHHACGEGCCKHRGLQSIVSIHKASHIEPAISHGRQCDDARRLLPGIGNRGSKRPSGCITIRESDLAVVFLFLQGFKCTLTWGKCFRISEAFSRLSHPFPSKTSLFGSPLQRRNTEAFLGGVGSALHPAFERTRLFFALVLGDDLFGRGKCGWSAAPRLIMQTLGAMVFPFLAPGCHGVSIDLRGLGDCLDRGALATQ